MGVRRALPKITNKYYAEHCIQSKNVLLYIYDAEQAINEQNICYYVFISQLSCGTSINLLKNFFVYCNKPFFCKCSLYFFVREAHIMEILTLCLLNGSKCID